MDKITFLALEKECLTALRTKRLGSAIVSLQGMVECLPQKNFHDVLTEVSEGYSYLLDYYKKGVADPSREQHLLQFLRKAYQVQQQMRRLYLLEEGTTHFAVLSKTVEKMSMAKSLSELREGNASPRWWFEVAWTGEAWTQSAYDVAIEMINHDKDLHSATLLLSGAMLSLMYSFDAYRFRFLVESVRSERMEIKSRALVGMVLAAIKNREILELYPDIKSQVETLADELHLHDTFLALQMQLLLSLNTQKIERSLREEIIPEMIKHVKNKTEEERGTFDITDDLMNDPLFNPEWDMNGSTSKLGEKMRELSEMHRKGADILMGSFKMLKQNYPFFSVAANWFYPYTPSHLEFDGKSPLPDAIKQIFANGMMCDSDKYSLHLMFQNMPQMQDMMTQQLGAMMGEQGSATFGSDAAVILPEEKLVSAIRLYVQDVYRYFKLFRHLDSQADPFLEDMMLPHLALFENIFASESIREELADFTFKEGFYTHAIILLQALPMSATNYQKMGYCYQKTDCLEQAVEHYHKAHLMQDNSTWTLRQLASGLKTLGRYDEALKYYEELEVQQPDDERILLALAECYLKTSQFSHAFDKLFKADYLYPDGKITQRALAWCSFLTDKYEKANMYYNKILGNSPTSTDHLNAGHNAWAQGRVEQALHHYQQSLRLSSASVVPTNFFQRDAQVLTTKGITHIQMALMLDAIASEYEA